MATIQEATAIAVDHYTAGRLVEAAEIGRRILAAAPGNAALAQLVGAASAALGDHARAGRAFRLAIVLDPTRALAWSNLANLDRSPKPPRRAAIIDPLLADAHANHAAALRGVGRSEAALAAARRALITDPAHRGGILNAATLLAATKRADTAVRWAERARRMIPGDMEAAATLAAALAGDDRLDEAAGAAEAALDRRPDFVAALEPLALIQAKRGDADASDRALERARAAGGTPSLDRTAAMAAMALARPRAAVAALDAALRDAPDDVGLNWNRAVALLQAGDWAEGWRAFEWRRRDDRAEPPWRDLGVPIWRGEPLEGRTILLHAEQGLGDALQCLRFVPLVASMGGRVVLEVQAPLRELAVRVAGADVVVARGAPLPPFALECPLMSLPGVLGATPDAIPGSVPFLSARDDLAAAWAERLADIAGKARLRVGLVWAGNPRFPDDRRRSPGLAALRSVLDAPGVHFLGLQKGEGRAALTDGPPLPANFTDLGPWITTMDDTAAIMAGLDLVISSCTAPAHLAGGLGRPLWLVLPYAPDWRWLLDRDDTPWYPTARLFRQPRPGDWGSVAERLRMALAH